MVDILSVWWISYLFGGYLICLVNILSVWCVSYLFGAHIMVEYLFGGYLIGIGIGRIPVW